MLCSGRLTRLIAFWVARFALIFDPPTVVLEYRDKSKDSLRHRKMQIPESCRHDVDVAVNKRVRHNNLHLHASVVSGFKLVLFGGMTEKGFNSTGVSYIDFN